MRYFTIFLLFVCLSLQLVAQEEKKENGWKINGLAHLIGQMDGKDFSNTTPPQYYTVMKFRLGVEKQVFDDLKFKLEMQDSRLLGQAEGVMNNIHNLDLFEGYLEFNNVANIPLAVQAGRFQMEYGTERIIGRSFWHINERVFDGARLKYKTDNFAIDYFHIIQHNSTDYILKIFPGLYPYPSQQSTSSGVYGIWSKIDFTEKNNLDLFAFMEANDTYDDMSNSFLTRNTAGMNYNYKSGDFETVMEFAYQFGTAKTEILNSMGAIENKTEKDIAAYLGSLLFNYKLKPVALELGGNIISGTDPDEKEKINTYSNYLASKHKFYGLMDYFLDIKRGTGNLGLNDFYFKVAYPGLVKNFSGAVILHHFMSNKESASGLNTFGQEIDLVFTYKVIKGTSIKFGGGIFLPGDLMKEMWRTSESERSDPSFWSFIMIVSRL
jgi:hypothetical protein